MAKKQKSDAKPAEELYFFPHYGVCASSEEEAKKMTQESSKEE